MELKDFKVGQKWKCRGDWRVVLTGWCDAGNYKLTGNIFTLDDVLAEPGQTFLQDGRYDANNGETCFDLISLIEDFEPEQICVAHHVEQSAIAKELIEKAKRIDAEAERYEKYAEENLKEAYTQSALAAESRARAAEYRRVAAIA